MNIILGVGTLVLVLIIMTLFLNFAPYGKQGLQALSGAACATFLPQAFLSYAIGGVFHVKFFQEIGDLVGSLSGVAVGILTCLKLDVSPVFAVIVGLVLHDSKLLPAFIAAYLVAFGIKFIEKKVPEGLDLIVVILLAPAVTFGLANLISPGVIAVLKQIGSAVTSVGDSNPYALAVILGLVIPVTGMTPLSSMVLTSLLGLTGIPMAIGALTCTGSSFVNGILFSRLKIGKKANAFAVFVEPLTQIDLIAKYPLQLYGTNALIGVVNACIVTFSGLVINIKGMATPIAGAIVLFGFNNPVTSAITIAAVAIASVVLAFITSTIIKRFNLMDVSFKLPRRKSQVEESV
ncbi:PTS sugar transporter subunit IIC [Staphylococcus saccharolyticus]|uniref:Regulatory protein pfoR n=1 Tax=Staphylococcus saccharolyticus TaxID=33028 RepID=A0A380GZ56_9STAP|nr:PTS sugar transporter subunit IIC [Staphylococcus saccharolyticus]MBL7564717.1 PTS sugar transporter subunit IIC [Staphylococcus saccharolyticus]MBL7571019.1 PTS sugar transporter subunit IIC [Staphylococcus saccharolyticus]QQB98870.1 PTS sugar transporter subunit IIC [Staphylococcus saccharolyticus]QRJ66915.1 PTS sugar transporter subunit IIC [Staphylococcus saccharolyticus]RTX98346.1 PTS sugar transporter subunit IIC [Staphylococcus saccharolyticus]